MRDMVKVFIYQTRIYYHRIGRKRCRREVSTAISSESYEKILMLIPWEALTYYNGFIWESISRL